MHIIFCINRENIVKVRPQAHARGVGRIFSKGGGGGVVKYGVLQKGSNCAYLCLNTLYKKCLKFPSPLPTHLHAR